MADIAVAGRSDERVAAYTYDPAGRQIAKSIDGDLAVQYGAACPELVEWDGSQCIAEYDADDALLRTFIYGPGIDQLHSARSGQANRMIETAESNAAYYYHFDALGSVIALSDDEGDTVVTYEYDAFGVPASSDPNHPNSFLFTGRRYDSETGLYHYRARAYNPYIGRFLQLDPAKQGMNWYAYCRNNALSYVDPMGMESIDVAFYDGGDTSVPTIGGLVPVPWPTGGDFFRWQQMILNTTSTSGANRWT